MATGQLSIRITVDGSDYYVSDDEFISSDATLHFPFVIQAPVVTLGVNRGGWIQFQAGKFFLESRPIDANHPFGGSRYSAELLQIGNTFPVAINFGVLGYDWITGVIVLESIATDVLQFSIYPDEYTTSPVSAVTDLDGNSVTGPWMYGALTHATPIIQKSATTWANPSGLTTGLTFYEDGSSLSATFTSDTITVASGFTGGEVSLSSSTSKTLEDFFDYVATQLSLDAAAADTTKAPNASSYGVKIYWQQETPLIEIASKVAEAYNHQFYIGPDTSTVGNDVTLFLIDRANSPTATVLDEDVIISAEYSLGYPLGGISGTYLVTQVEGSKLVEKEVSFRSENKPVGRELTAPVFADTYGDASLVSGRLQAIRNIEKKAVVTVTVPEIQVDYKPGDRFQFSREIDFLTADLIARTITWDFRTQTTTLSGDATLSAYIRAF